MKSFTKTLAFGVATPGRPEGLGHVRCGSVMRDNPSQAAPTRTPDWRRGLAFDMRGLAEPIAFGATPRQSPLFPIATATVISP